MLGWLLGKRNAGLVPEPLSGDIAPSPSDDIAATASAGRRDRALDDGSHQLRDGIAQKILHGWLQNRNQTLYPLTVNLRTLKDVQRAALADWMAIALLAGRGLEEARVENARRWLSTAGADADTLNILNSALNHPSALSESLASIAEHGLGPYAYVLALIGLEPADPATSSFLDYVSIRLNLPTTVVRSATRRYRR